MLGFVEDAESSEVETLQVEILCDEVGAWWWLAGLCLWRVITTEASNSIVDHELRFIVTVCSCGQLARLDVVAEATHNGGEEPSCFGVVLALDEDSDHQQRALQSRHSFTLDELLGLPLCALIVGEVLCRIEAD
jgi:hypothetical protein